VATIGALVSVIVPLILVRDITEALVELEWPIAVYVALAAVLGYGPGLLWCWFVCRRWGSGRFRRDVGLQARWSDLGWGPVVYLCCLIAQISAGIVITLLGIPAEGNIGEVDDVDRTYAIAILVLAVVAAPIAEEIIFRGVMLRGLRSVMGAVPAVAIQAVVFGAVHIDPVLGAGNVGLVMVLSAVGAVLGGAAYLFRRIVPSMIAHAILNSIALTLALTGVLDRLLG
jgi:membrane protease YdiL (CAAX protease family)